MSNTPPSLILGWASRLEADEKSDAARLHPLNKKRGHHDLSYAVQYHGDGHCITFAPTGSGKGVGAIIPNLLHYAGPVIVIDPKGENFAVTARYRQEVLGQKIMLLDPFNAVPQEILGAHSVRRDSLNPMDLCRMSGHSLENDSQMISKLLAGTGGVSDDPFWDTSGQQLLSGIIAHEMDQANKTNRLPLFRTVIDRLFSDDTIYSLAVVLDTEKPTKFANQCISSFLSLADVTRSGVLAMAQSYLSTVMAGDLQPHLNKSTVDLATISAGSDYTLYIVIPPNKLDSHSFLLRVWISVLLHAVMERKELPAQRTLFILDECANLGELDALRKAVTLLRGYGLQVWMFFQDISQLIHLYQHDHQTMLNNCGVLQSFGAARLSASKPISALIGTYTANDILKLDRTQQVLSVSPGKVRTAKLFKYYEDGAFAGRFDANPLIRKRQNVSAWITHRAPRNHYRFI